MLGAPDDIIHYVYIIRLKPYKTRPSTSIFMVNYGYDNEKKAIEYFINDLRSHKYGVIKAHMLDYNFEFVEETTLDGIRCNLYKSKCGDEMYVHKVDIYSSLTCYLGGNI